MLPESGSTISVHTEVGGGGGGMTSAVITEAPPVGASSCRGTGAPHRPQNFQLPWFALPHWTQYLSQIRIGNGAVRRRCLLPKIFYKWTFHSDGQLAQNILSQHGCCYVELLLRVAVRSSWKVSLVTVPYRIAWALMGWSSTSLTGAGCLLTGSL